MERIYKFRGKSKKFSKWVYGSLIFLVDKRFIITQKVGTIYSLLDKSLVDALIIEVTPESVGQFIGRCDKNNREIYAGDIVEWKNNFGDKIIGWIRYTESRAGFYVVLIKGGYQTFYDFGGGRDKKNFAWSKLIVVGNQTENPEMMKYEYWNGETEENAEKKNEFLKKFDKS